MGVDVIINAAEAELTRVVKSVRTEWLNDKNKHINGMLVPLKAFAANQAKNNANESLSQQGKHQADRTYATNETVPQLKFVRKEIKDMEAKDQRYRTQFFTVSSGINDAVERMPTYTYLWNKFDPLDQAARVTQFAQAAAQDQVTVLAAMLEHPLGPMIDKEVKERALTERAKRLFPKDFENYEQNQILLEYLTMMRDWIGRWLGVEIGVEIEVIRTNLGDAIADALKQQTTGIPVEA